MEFGSRVSVHIPKEKRQKLDPKSKRGILVGYSDEVKGYRIYFPYINKVEIHRDIVILAEEQEVQKKYEKLITLDCENQLENNEDLHGTEEVGKELEENEQENTQIVNMQEISYNEICENQESDENESTETMEHNETRSTKRKVN
ncbi:uncharacterized protein [Leptinotarsa decemlineata]|uniref:uncharacterized protein n=1 Tax=Leptinotarsa decemlineata TaxID=7539 RepID=UPI003D30D176